MYLIVYDYACIMQMLMCAYIEVKWVTAIIQRKHGRNENSVIIKFSYYLKSGRVLFESELGLAVNVYCKL